MKRSLTFILMLGGVMLGALSGCEKEKSATEPVYNPISRLDAEVLLKQWNAERKGRLKSATTLNLTEEQWGRAKVYQNLDEAISTISIPLSKWKVLCFGKNREGAGVYFCEVRPDDHYLELNGGRINKSTYTGYLVFFNDKGKGIAAYCYVDGRFKGVYEVATQQSFFKDITKEVFNLEEVVVVANRESPWKWIHDGNKGWTLNLCMPDYTFEERGGGYSNGTSNPDPKPEVDTSDASFRNTKAACILAKLLGKTNTTMYDPSTVVGKLLKDYWGKTAAGAHNLKFVVSPSSMLVSGSTHAQCETDKSGKSNNVIIRISQEYMESCSNIELVRTLIHESIHAEIYVRMQGLNGGVSTDADFARLFEQYKTYGDQRDHNIMAESDYVNLIAQGLKAYHDAGYMAEFDANVGKVYGEDFDSQKFYSMMAWIGLEDSKEFNLKKNDKVWHSDYLNYNKASGMCDLKDCK